MRRPSACGLREFHFGAPQTQGLGLARPLLIRWRAAGAGRRPDDGARRHVQFRQPVRSRPPARASGMRLRGASQPGRARRRTAAASMRGGRERGPALPGRRRLGGHACGIPARCRAPRIPQVGRRVDRARRALPVLSAQDRDRGVRAGRRDREEGPQGRVHSDHLRHADHHGAPHGLLQQARLERGGDQDRRLGGHPRQDPQQGIRRRPHAFADADRDHARRRLERRSRTPCRRSRTSTARPSRSR